MNNINIKERYRIYQEGIERVGQRQRKWQKKTRSFIEKTLADLKTKYNLAAEVAHEDQITNLEAVYLNLGKKESGFVDRRQDKKQMIQKDLGSLMYSQVYNGKISVWIRYPVIENLMQRQKPKVINVYEPEAIKKNDILMHLNEFFKELDEWENQDTGVRHEIGF